MSYLIGEGAEGPSDSSNSDWGKLGLQLKHVKRISAYSKSDTLQQQSVPKALTCLLQLVMLLTKTSLDTCITWVFLPICTGSTVPMKER